ncbi:MAG: outer membrane beta-barrel protein [Pseudomonadota bacterium]
MNYGAVVLPFVASAIALPASGDTGWRDAAASTWNAISSTDYYASAGGSLFIIHDQVDQDLEQGFDYGNLTAVTLRGGAKVHPYVSLEGEAAVGAFEHDAIELFSDSSVKLDSYLAASAVGRLPVTPRADLTARLGYSAIDIGVEFNDALAGPGRSNQETDGLSYGAGIDYALTDRWDITGDVTVLQGNARIFEQRIAAISITVKRDF